MTDSHAHLDACDEPAAALIERAQAAGVTRIVTIGTGIESSRAALAIAERHEGVHAALGIDPHQAAQPEAERLAELRELLAHPKAVAVGETGLDTVRRFATPEEQRRLFDAQLALADELGLPVVVHNREADDETAAALAPFTGTVVLHCFSSPGLVMTAVERGYYVSFAGNVTFPNAVALREAASAVPADRILVETDSPYLAPATDARRAERARQRGAYGPCSRRGAGRHSRGRGRPDTRQCGRSIRVGMSVAPKKALGQHFLVDENILGVIERLSDLRSTDVVLEVGPGLGILTRRLAERVRLVHSIELDRSLEPELRAALGAYSNVRLIWGDALQLAIDELEPEPTKLVANLPYNVATPLVVESLEHAPSLQRWCVMVQREVADRFFAEPRTKAYGAVSVLVQLSARKVGFHAVSPSVFRPPPRVDSALVAFERDVVAPISDVRPAVEAAFAHRRKTAANSIALSGLAPRTRVAEALNAMGHPMNARAEELEPREFVQLAELLA